jgi:hypothetical protein
MTNKWADGHLLEYCAQYGKEIYVENIVMDEESDDETPFCSENCMVKFEPDGAQHSCIWAWRTSKEPARKCVVRALCPLRRAGRKSA